MTASTASLFRVATVTRVVGLGAIGLDCALIARALTGADSPLRFPGGGTLAWEAAGALAAYGVAFAAMPGRLGGHREAVLRIGGAAGIFAGALQVIHMTLENYGARTGENAMVTLAFMLAAFLTWGVAAYRASRVSGGVGTGIAAGCTSAMESVAIAVTFGLVLMLAEIPPAAYVATWDEFKRSGWSSARAFAIANSLDATFGHLAVAPVVGAIFGFFGGVVGSVAARRAR